MPCAFVLHLYLLFIDLKLQETNTFYLFQKCKPLLDANPRASFATDDTDMLQSQAEHPKLDDKETAQALVGDGDDSEDEVEEGELPNPAPPGFLDPRNLPQELLEGACVLERRARVQIQVKLNLTLQ